MFNSVPHLLTWVSDTHRNVGFVFRLPSLAVFDGILLSQVNHGKSISSLADQKLKESILEKWVRVLVWLSRTFLIYLFLEFMTVLNHTRYMLVDREEDKKTHRPVVPKDVSFPLYFCFFTSNLFHASKSRCTLLWQAPKKLVRYHGNQVVTTKGERYQLVKKDETEDMKKTYVNLKPARKYRFHWWRAQFWKSS